MPYKIVYNKNGCIGAGECAVIAPDLWKVGNDGQAILAGSKQNPKTGNFELVISDAACEKQKKAAGSCPVAAIIIEKC